MQITVSRTRSSLMTLIGAGIVTIAALCTTSLSTPASAASTTVQIPGLHGSGYSQTLAWQFGGQAASTQCVKDLKHGVPACIDPVFNHVSWVTGGAHFLDESGTCVNHLNCTPGGRLDVAPSSTLSTLAYPGSHNFYMSVTMQLGTDTSANLFNLGLTEKDPTDPTHTRNLAFMKEQVNSCVMIGTDGIATSVYGINQNEEHATTQQTCQIWDHVLYIIENGKTVGSKPIKGNGIITDTEHHGLTIGAKENPQGQYVDSTDELTGYILNAAIGMD